MSAHWSLVLNVLLLVGVLVTMIRLMRARRKQYTAAFSGTLKPCLGQDTSADDIIRVRKISCPDEQNAAAFSPIAAKPMRPAINRTVQEVAPTENTVTDAPTIMFFLLAKENRQLGGYELLQTVLAVGFRFGEGGLFHRHQAEDGHGPVLCSLAAATASGTFDLENMGAFKAHGLCLFMMASGHAAIDSERFALLLETAKQLSDDLDTHLLDDAKRPFSNTSMLRYQRILGIEETAIG